MPIATASAQVKRRDLTATFNRAVRAAVPFFPRICNVSPSNGFDEAYGWFGAMPAVREWLGDRIFNEMNAASVTVVNKDWENSLLIKRNDFEDDRLAQYGVPLQLLGTEAAFHPDLLVFDLFINGETGLAFDGQPFFDTAHVWGDSGAQSNDITAPAVDPTDPTADEFRDAYHAARRQLLRFRNDKGNLINRPTLGEIEPSLLFIPPEQEVAANALAAGLVGGGNTNVVLGSPSLNTINYFTDPTKFYLTWLSGPIRPFIFQNRQPLRTEMKGMDDLEQKDLKFMTDARYEAAYAAWWTTVLVTFV